MPYLYPGAGVRPQWCIGVASIRLGAHQHCACSDGGRETVLLSCTHVFHLKCIQAFENFNVFGKRQCPVCRADYHKRIMP